MSSPPLRVGAGDMLVAASAGGKGVVLATEEPNRASRSGAVWE